MRRKIRNENISNMSVLLPRTIQKTSDICERLVKEGHEVQVVTGYPNYPLGELYEGYGKGKRVDEIINGVKVHRSFEIPRKKGTINRF